MKKCGGEGKDNGSNSKIEFSLKAVVSGTYF
jgi:hypothetical protein